MFFTYVSACFLVSLFTYYAYLYKTLRTAPLVFIFMVVCVFTLVAPVVLFQLITSKEYRDELPRKMAQVLKDFNEGD